MLFEDKQVPELNYMKHRHDNDNVQVDYGSKIMSSLLAPYLFNNDTMNTFLLRLQKPVSLLFDQMNVMKNFKNYIVDKYYYKHSN
jgi:hypothetical protein